MHSRLLTKAVKRCLSGGHGGRVTCSSLLLRNNPKVDLQYATVQSHKVTTWYTCAALQLPACSIPCSFLPHPFRLLPSPPFFPFTSCPPCMQLMLKAGLVRQSTAGVYHLLPLGMRALERLVALVDQEMRAIGGAKMALSILSPAAQWKASGM